MEAENGSLRNGKAVRDPFAEERHTSKHLRPIVITALHTGDARGEILRLKWEDVDVAGKTLSVRESKNEKGRHLPISSMLHDTLSSFPSRFRGGWDFPSNLSRRKPGAKALSAPFTDLKSGFHAALRKVGIANFFRPSPTTW